MKMNSNRKTELEVLMYFMPNSSNHISITEEDTKKYFEWSEQGKHKRDIKQSHFTDGFNALVSAKQWRGRNIHELWEPGVLEGDTPYYVLLGGHEGEELMPRVVVEFMKREMFKGVDSELIETLYKEISEEKKQSLIN